MSPNTERTALKRILVLGGSLTGLLAAQVLAPYTEQVVVVDRDDLDSDLAMPRRGAPQGAHVHALLLRGAQAFEDLLPGFQDALVARGARILPQSNGEWIFGGRRLDHRDTSLMGVSASRTLIESEVRRRAAATPNVRLIGGVDVVAPMTSGNPLKIVGFEASPTGNTGAGQRLEELGRRDDHGRYQIEADLVIDATGRASRTPFWLKEMGYSAPKESVVTAGITYTTQYLRDTSHQAGTTASIIIGTSPESPRGAGAVHVEGGQWTVTLVGQAGEKAPGDPAGFLEYTRSLGSDVLTRIVHKGEPIGEALAFTYPKSRWRHYEKLRRRPAGLIVMGDAVASFNPIYGQGMSSAAAQGQALRDVLRSGDLRDLEGRSARAFARIVRDPWQLSTGADRRFPGQPAKPWAERLVDAYLDRLLRTASTDPVVAAAFMRVLNLMARPATLFHPTVLRRVLSQKTTEKEDEMTLEQQENTIAEWIVALNDHDAHRVLTFFTEDAVLNDPSVGHRFEGIEGIEQYYRDYFIGYNTRTRLVGVTPTPEHLHVEVHFTGNFPGGQTDGIFDITFSGDLISFIHADLA
jgi:2-polyprenyl-6-methoxyphenol hydroxylase-like FAD-dependent oxidoreductase